MTSEKPQPSYDILGPLRVLATEAPVTVRTGKQRDLLGLLLLARGRPVSPELLIAELWGGRPPKSAANALQVHVSQLRRTLPEDALGTHPDGYAIEAPALDADRFEHDLDAAREARRAGDSSGAAERLDEGLALWRGNVLAGSNFRGTWATGEIGRLEELRLAALELRAELRLEAGEEAEAVPGLEALVRSNPLHEGFRIQLMTALYRLGRQADALEAYGRARATFVEELGVEPGPRLRELQRAILAQDESLRRAGEPDRVETAATPPGRKTVTVIFARVAPDVLGDDPEIAQARLDEAVAPVAATLQAHGGELVPAPGAGVIALFGVRGVREDDALRAARAAREVLAFPTDGTEIKLGVASGEMLADQAHGAEGGVVRHASELARAAAPGTILLSEQSLAYLGSGATTEPFNDRRGALTAHRLVGLDEDAEPISRTLDRPMVGRSRELAQLRRALAAVVRERSCRLITVAGAAGIGKSRLASELRRGLDADTLALSGRCHSHAQPATLWPLYEVVRAAAGEVSVDAVTALLSDQPDGAAVARRVVAAFGGRGGDHAVELHPTFRRLFETIARRQPTVLLLEDMHWADETLLDLVEHLTDAIEDAPLLIVCLARPELLELGPLWSRRVVRLEPLGPVESLQLVESIDERTPLGLAGRIVDAAEGNPLFIEQVLALATEAGEPETLTMPPSIHALLEARVDQLPATERELLQRAAVAGREFARNAVAGLLGHDDVTAELQSLERKDLIEAITATFGGESYRFRHGMIREVAYDSLPKRTRAELHALLAAWFERSARDESLELDEAIGYHLEQAAQLSAQLGIDGGTLGERASFHLARAGRRAHERGQAPRAAELLGRAAALSEDTPTARARLLVDLAEALRDAGGFQPAQERLDEAEELSREAGDLLVLEKVAVARLRIRLFTDLELTSAEVSPRLRQAIDVFEEAGDETGLAQAWHLVGWVAWLACRADDAVRALGRSVEHARRSGGSRAEAQAIHLLVGAHLFGPTPADQAAARCRAVMATYADHQRVVASATRALAGVEAMRGRFEDAHALIAEDRALLEELGLRISAAAADEIYGWVFALEGRLDAAEAEYRHGLESFRVMGDVTAAATLAAGLAQVLCAQGRYEEALGVTEESRAGAGADDLHTQIQWRGPHAKALARAERIEEALQVAQEGVLLAQPTDFLNVQATALLDLGEVIALAGDKKRAAACVRQAIELFERKGNTVGAAASRRRL